VADGKGNNPVLIVQEAHTPRFSPKGDKIAYISHGQLYIANVDGSDPVQLNGHTGFPGSHSFSPDGNRIVFSAQPGRAGCCFHAAFIVNIDGTGLRQLSNLPQDNVQHPVFSPNGTQVVVQGPGQSGSYGMWILDTEGGEPQQILDGTLFDVNDGFNFSPDGKTIYFRGHDLNSQSDIYSIQIDGALLTRLTFNPNQQKSWPLLSPDGCQILFEDVLGSNRLEYWIMDTDGSNRQLAIELADSTDRILTALVPQAWSRDGNTLLFMSHRDNPIPFMDSLRYTDIYSVKLPTKCSDNE
jgi:Tol biopolymer transport system component